LYEALPDYVIVRGKKVRLDLDFRNVLRMIDILTQDDLTDEAREWLAMRCICKRPVKGMVPAVRKLLFPQEAKKTKERIMDYAQDADLIRAAFQQAYGIDLYKDKLHWFRFSCLLSCLPEGTRYSDVLGIRSRPIPEATKYNQEERNWLIQAKAKVRLQLTEKELQDKYESDVSNIAAVLMGMAGGSENNG
jgi:hypothetical protein